MESLQDVSVVRPHNILLERSNSNDVSRGRNNNDPSVRLHDVTSKSQIKYSATTQWYVTSGKSLWRLQSLPKKIPNNVAVLRLRHVSELHCRDALLVGLYYVFKLPCHDLHLVGFYVSFKYQIKYQITLVLTRRETQGVVWISRTLITLKNVFIQQQYL